MVEGRSKASVSGMAIQLSLVFGILGVGLLYLAILISDASNLMKIVWASGLSLGVATAILLVRAMLMDVETQRELEQKQRSVK